MATTKKKIEVKTRKSQADKYPQNIPQETFDVWQANRRKGDPEEMMKPKHLNCSRPIVERALNFGHVKEAWIIDKINKFFTDRLKKELAKTQELIALTKEAAQTKKITTKK